MLGLRFGRAGWRAGASAWRGGLTLAQTRHASQAAQGTRTSPLRRLATYVLLGTTCSAAGAAGAWYQMQKLGLGFFSDEESLTRFTPEDNEAREVEQIINSHPMIAELRARPELKESRPHLRFPAQYRRRSMTAHSLQGPGLMVVPPYAWIESGKSLVSVSKIGDNLCGHPGLVHGGLLATMLDEGLARTCMDAMPRGIVVTANLNVDYRKPTPAGSFLVLRAETIKIEGRKVWVSGRIESLPMKPSEKPVVYAEGKALFISPKYAAMMPRIN